MRALATAVLVLGVSSAASAADIPRAEGFGGYSYARASDESLHGWSATFGYNFTRLLEVEAEVSAHHGSFDNGTDLGRQSFLAGPRLNFRAGRVTPFVRALAGAVRTSSGITVQNVDISARRTDLGGAAGAGLDVAMGRHWGVRLQGDYFLVRAEGETVSDPRGALGVTYRLGRKGVTAAK